MLRRTKTLKEYITDISFATLAIAAGALVVYAGDLITGVKLELYYGIIDTFSPLWIVNLVVFPFIAGMVVSAIYGLGGKIISHFAPILIRLPMYIAYYNGSATTDSGSLLPLGFWILILIVVVEAAGGGGIVGEIIIKKTYGRRPQHEVYKRYQARDKQNATLEKQTINSQP